MVAKDGQTALTSVHSEAAPDSSLAAVCPKQKGPERLRAQQ